MLSANAAMATDRTTCRPGGLWSAVKITTKSATHGDRLSSLVDFESLKLAAAAVILSPSIPLLFMGEEWGGNESLFIFHQPYGPQTYWRRCATVEKRNSTTGADSQLLFRSIGSGDLSSLKTELDSLRTAALPPTSPMVSGMYSRPQRISQPPKRASEYHNR